MSHPLTTAETVRRYLRRTATDHAERTGVDLTPERLAELAEEVHPGQLDPIDLEDLAHEVLEDLRRYPPGRARLAMEAAR